MKKKNAGFTLIEIAVALLIISAIAAASIRPVAYAIEGSAIKEERAKGEVIADAIRRGFSMGGSYDVSTWVGGGGDWAAGGCGPSAYPYGDTEFDPRPEAQPYLEERLPNMGTNYWMVKVGRVMGYNLQFDGNNHAYVARSASAVASPRFGGDTQYGLNGYIYPARVNAGLGGNAGFSADVVYNKVGRRRTLLLGPPVPGSSTQRFLLISQMMGDDDTGTQLPYFVGWGNAATTASYAAYFDFLWSLDTSVANVTIPSNPTSDTAANSALAGVADSWNAMTNGRTNLARLVMTKIVQQKYEMTIILPSSATRTIIPCVGGYDHSLVSSVDTVSATPTPNYPALSGSAYGLLPSWVYGTLGSTISGPPATLLIQGDRIPHGRRVWLVQGADATDTAVPVSGSDYSRLTGSATTRSYTIVADMAHEWF